MNDFTDDIVDRCTEDSVTPPPSSLFNSLFNSSCISIRRRVGCFGLPHPPLSYSSSEYTYEIKIEIEIEIEIEEEIEIELEMEIKVGTKTEETKGQYE